MTTSRGSIRPVKKLLVTGGAGFIGSAFVRYLLSGALEVEKVVNLDLLTYAGSLDHLQSVQNDSRHHFIKGDILDAPLVETLLKTHEIDTLVHFAAESHVDRSIADPTLFYRTNVEGTVTLLEVARKFPGLHVHQISTDEVYGSIESGEFTEESPYRPSSPYAASKAAADHFVRAYAKTYGLSVTLSHCSNNYGPCQDLEKLIPKMIHLCLNKNPLPLYGEGLNVRDWLYVEDHAKAVYTILKQGVQGESYNIGGAETLSNRTLLDRLFQRLATHQNCSVTHFEPLITYVADRPGHDFRYALSSKKIQEELGWEAKSSLDQGLDKTINWVANGR